MKIKPTNDNIVIKIPKEEKEKVTKSGIIISRGQDQQAMPEKGIVSAIGDGRILMDGRTVKPSVKVGDEVIFSKFAGTKISDAEQEYLIIKENDILAIIEA